MAKKKNVAEPIDSKALWKFLAWAVAAGTWALLVCALVSFDPADPPGHSVAPLNTEISNWVGRFGAVVAYKAYVMLGPGVWLAVIGWAAILALTMAGRTITQPAFRIFGVILMAVATSSLVGLVAPNLSHQPELAGGLLATYINGELTPRFAVLGTMLILVVAFWIGAIFAIDQVVFALPRLIGRWCAALAGSVHMPNPVLVGRLPSVASLWAARRSSTARAEIDEEDEQDSPPVRRGGRRRQRREVENPIDEDAGGLGATESFDPEANTRKRRGVVEEEEEEDAEVEATAEDGADEEVDEESAADAPGAYVAEKRRFDPDELRAKMQQLPIKFKPTLPTKPAPPREIDLSGYQFPGLDLLVEPESNFTDEMERMVRDQAVQLESALQQYRIEGEVVGIDSGPVITLYEVRLAPGTKVAALNNISSDLARALRAQNIRIVPNMAGKDTVGVEVPNLVKEKVRLKELMTSDPEKLQKMSLPMFLGKDASGNPLIADLASMPHMLIAGTTGSGKSVCMNTIIMSFLYTKKPNELKLVLVDPKMVEMSMFKDIPHLMCPVVTEMSKAAAILEWAVTKMDERYELLAEAGVRDIASYNSLSWEELKERFQPSSEEEEARIPKKLPFLVFVIDELADLMMTNKEVESFIVRIAQKARAVGMHLILATQRPQANVVTGLIKSNMPCRVSFKVASGMDSRIVLDSKGAELLLGQGDMLFLSPRTSKLTRAQGTLVDDLEIRKAVRFLKTVAEQNFEPQLVQIKGPGSLDADEERDPLFDDAVRVVLETQRGSVSLLQRRLTIGYSRASRLIEQMAQAGLLGEYKGSQAREVTITLEEWEALKAQAEADASGGAVTVDSSVDVEEDEEVDFDASQEEDEFELDEDDDAEEEEEE